ncbi:DgyrCDS7137 [Dimorphilus gyrociliatus]|uniref:DgyrCDS7137 n=1 Tax=Dimorphilus gyrociliatus TaxID=2664684 RepID=A0A7I8VRT2_9ANNE|nr:DgyrCDS7137 [Dimorphilus gyrociliatus]
MLKNWKLDDKLGSCFKWFPTPLYWEDAQATCRAYGAHLIETLSYEEADIKFTKAKLFDNTITEFWIGLRKNKNQVVSGDTLEDKALWHGSDREATLSEGFWYYNQPNTELGDCTYLKENSNFIYDKYYSLDSCIARKPFLCEADACLEGQFRCNAGNCIKNSYKCDGKNDCGDDSDELACPNTCKFIEKDPSKSIIKSNYAASEDCIWLLETEIGKRIKLDFTKLITEKDRDVVEVWSGGRSISTSSLLSRYSGDRSSSLPSVYSNNNFLIIRFYSDSAKQLDGFEAKWASVDRVTTGSRELKTNGISELTSPDYPNFLLGGLREEWTIEVEKWNGIITIEKVEIELGAGNYLIVKDGKESEAATLGMYQGNSGPSYITSTGRFLKLYLITGNKQKVKGFKFTYKEGCDISIDSTSGIIISPGYNGATTTYPPSQTCLWNITSPGGSKLTFQFDSKSKLAKYGLSDTIKIFDDINNPTQVASISKTDQTIGPTYEATSGSASIVFTTGAVEAGIGFKATFSGGCEKPQFNTNTQSTAINLALKGKITVTCKEGYAFTQEEHQQKTSVEMICEVNGWNVHAIPNCEAVSCNIPPVLNNGYVIESTGITFGKTVKYNCRNGFRMVGDATITCQKTGQWTSKPSCIATSCDDKFSSSNFPGKKLESGQGEDYGSVWSFTCSPGQELTIYPTVVCLGNDWSSTSNLACSDIICKIPTVDKATFTPNTPPKVNEEISVSCATGYKIEGNSVMKCLETGIFNEIPKCIDDNECDNPAKHKCTGNAICVNTEGSHECECPSGYQLTANKTSCEDFNECDVGNGDCDHKCSNSEGSYECSCNNGFVLFDEDGKNGFFIPSGETGRESWNKFHLNHTCIRVRCPIFKPDDLPNGVILGLNNLPSYQDKVYITCDLGYQLAANEPNFLTCTASGQYDRSPPPCLRANCTKPKKDQNIQGYYPTVTQSQVAYGETMDLICNRLTLNAKIYSERCEYDSRTHTYEIVAGVGRICDNVLDCGRLDKVEGVEPFSVTTATTFGGEADFVCKNLFTLKGSQVQVTTTALPPGKLHCRGRFWNLGDLRCEGDTCSDPGTPAGGKQIATSYTVNSDAIFTCDRPGFQPTFPNITCISDTTVKWSGPIPTCDDVEVPVFQNCPSSTISIDKLKAANIPQVTATDNSGLVKSFTVNPIWFSSNVALKETLDVTYTAEDHAGNQAKCSFTIRVKDDQPPSISCPTSYVHRITENRIGYSVTDNNAATATDNLGTPTITYNPSTIDYTTNDALDRTNYVISATATDSDGNSASCKYMITVIPEKCQLWAIKAPKDGYAATPCALNQGTGIASCRFRCNSGKVPRHISPAGTNNIGSFTMEYKCDSTKVDAVWSWEYESGKFLDYVPDCQDAIPARYLIEYDITYEASTSIPTNKNCDQHYSSEMQIRASNDTNFLNVMNKRCSAVLENLYSYDLSFQSKYFNYQQTSSDSVKYHLGFFVGPNSLLKLSQDICKFIILINLQLSFDEFPTGEIPATNDCPRLVQRNDTDSTVSTRIDNNFICPKGEKLVLSSAKLSLCVKCDKGTYFNETSNDCLPCPAGQYQDEFGRSECKKCGDDEWTPSEGSLTQSDCKPACKTYGMISATKVGPCVECAANSYMIDSSNCQPCDGSKKTEGTGKSSPDDCKEPCALGFFSRKTGFTACEKCPVNFYSEVSASTTCKECAGTEYTVTDESKSSSDCLDAVANLCNGALACSNQGTCSVQNHKKICSCNAGYDGESCENQINHCLSSPCYNGGTCNGKVNGFTCSCPNGITGDRCETTTKRCTSTTCTFGFCKDNPFDTECLCPPGYTGSSCEQSSDICANNPCKNNGECRTSGSKGVHIECHCDFSRFFGKRCEFSKEPCSINPCLYGGVCESVDEIEYKCKCSPGFSGKNCEIVPPCTPNICGDSGICKFDFKVHNHICICKEGYVAAIGANNNTWLQSITAASVGQCVKSNACTSSPCQNNAVCEQKNTGVGYECKCKPGYSGGNCQNNIDECAIKPCGRYGEKCEDLIADYKCTCQTGVTGKNCDGFEDKCVSNPCDPTGTNSTIFDNGCEKILNSYICHCKDGFEGQDCGVNINDCPGNICRHGGVCKDLVNDWQCDCKSGWTGKFCETPKDFCQASPCTNGGTCFNSENGYFCLCRAGDHGKTCNVDSRMCTKVDACIDNDATCSDNNDGSATCTCSRNYIGESCHIKRDFCSGLGICLNGGQCSYTKGGFSCNCPEDFSGDICEISHDDCQGKTCLSAAATCVDGVGDYFCECPLGKIGDDCSRDADRNFELVFSSPTRTAMAFQRYPFILNVTEFTVSVGAIFDIGEIRGTFLTLFGLEHRYLTSDRKEILKINERSVKTTLNGKEKEFNFPNNALFNDGLWHFIGISWTGSTGKLDIYIDGLLRDTQTFGKGAELPEYGLFVLGSEMDATGHRPVEKFGFTGALSQVTMWNRPLSLQEMRNVLSKTLLTPNQLPKDFISLWDNYISSEGVDTREFCFSQLNCQQNLNVDKTPPVILNCPAEPIEKYGSKRHTILSWDDLTANEVNSTISIKHPKDRPFVWGYYRNLAVASDTAGNRGTCFFHVFVQYHQQCSAPTTPSQGTISCKDYGLFSACKYSVPTCDDAQRAAASDHLNSVISSLDTIWKRPDGSGAFCGTTGCDASNVQFEAKCQTSKRRRRATGAKIAVTGVLSGSIPPLVERKNPDDTLSPVDVLKQELIDNSAAPIPGNNNAVPDYSTLSLGPQGICPPGQVDFGKGCVECSRGTKEDGGVCKPCPIGEYQDDLAQTTCKPCPTGTTELAGTSSVNDCHEKCSSGRMFDKTTSQCVECPIGFYQNEEGSFFCKPCDSMKTTLAKESNNVNQCIDVCPDGEEMIPGTATRDCRNCTYGFYRKAGIEESCTKCPIGKTTPELRSVTESQCTLIYCLMGQQPKSATECEDCPKGSYQDKEGWPKCKTCPDDKGTIAEGSTKESQCLIKCDAGKESKNSQCVDCEIISFKPKRGVESCTECPTELRTRAPGSKFPGDCVLKRCTLGEKLINSQVEPGSCEKCPEDFYQDTLYQTTCKACPNNKLTIGIGSKNESDCIDDCPIGQGFNFASRTCELCDQGTIRVNGTKPVCTQCSRHTYQDERGQQSCKPCPNSRQTNSEGAKFESDCLDPCKVSKLCPKGTKCQFVNGKVNCPCEISHYVTNNTNITHPECTQLCGNPEYCVNGICDSSYVNDEIPPCKCNSGWEGPRCDNLKKEDSYTKYIIGGSIGGAVFLILLCIAIAYAVYRSNYKNKKNALDEKKFKENEPVIAPSGLPQHNPSMATLSRIGPGTIGHTMPSMSYYPTFARSRADDISIAGFSVASKYVYHEDIDETPLKPINNSTLPLDPDSEEKMSTIDFPGRGPPPQYTDTNGSAKAIVRNS